MLLASFSIKNSTHTGFGAEAEQQLRRLAGVSDVLIGEVNDVCSVVYDEARVSTLVLGETLQAAGYDCQLDDISSRPSASSCCGACS